MVVYRIGVWLSVVGIFSVMVGAWFVAYEVVNQFEGATYGGHTPTGGVTHITKHGAFVAWEVKRKRAMWVGLILITLGSFLQVAGLFC